MTGVLSPEGIATFTLLPHLELQGLCLSGEAMAHWLSTYMCTASVACSPHPLAPFPVPPASSSPKGALGPALISIGQD
jgi:hypothetical protein